MISRTNAILDPQTNKIIVQTPFPPINCLAFEGGGLRCTAYAGCYKVLYNTGIMNEVLYVSGSSGGAISASGVALGFDPDEIKSIMLSMDLGEFLEDSRSALSATDWYSCGKTLLSIFRSEKYSLSTGNKFLEWLRSTIETKFGKKPVTFVDLAKKVKAADNHGKYKYLYVTGTNLSLELPECKIFSHETTPDMEIALAVYISALIPLVFSLREYDGSLWGDGGLIRNLPTTVFDDRKYLPEGYDFNEKGKNPGVLAIKVDSKSEIDQILYGVVKKVDLASASNVANALYHALAQNTDTDEIRESRLTLALQDNNVGTLEFTVNMNGKIGLISTGEKETQNFVENYYNAAYYIKTYDNVVDWLNDLSLDELDDVIAAYEIMLKNIKQMDIMDGIGEKSAEKSGKKSRETGIGKNEMTPDKINEYILFLDHYLNYKRQLKRNRDGEMNIPLPGFHVNLSPVCLNNKWNKIVEYEMKERLKHVNRQIEYLDIKINSMSMEFRDFPVIDKITLLHHHFYFDNIQALTNLMETQKLFHAEKSKLHDKLGHAQIKRKQSSPQEIKNYADFSHLLNPLLSASSIPQDLAIILPASMPVFKFEAYRGAGEVYLETERTIFILDLRKKNDCTIYMVAAMLYLTYTQSINKDYLLTLYHQVIPGQFPVPKNMKELTQIFHMSSVGLLVTAYRIEALLQYFERKANPGIKKSVINLDALFGTDKFYKFSITEISDVKRDIPMKHIIHSNSIFSYHPSPSCSGSPSQSGSDFSSLTGSGNHELDKSNPDPNSDEECPYWFGMNL